MDVDSDNTMHLILMMTHSCNLHCNYCYEHHQSGKTMSALRALSIIRKEFEKLAASSQKKRLEIVFMGGEPLLCWDTVCSIVETVEKERWPCPYHFFAATNATLLDDAKKEWIEKRKEHFILGISVDGTGKMQSTNRGFTATNIDLDYFVKTWPAQAPKMTISHDTLPMLAEGVKYLHKTGFENIQANLAMGQKDWEKGDYRIYADQLKLLIEYYMENPHVKRCALLNLDILTSLNLDGKYRKFCGCGENVKCIDYDGKEYPCQMFAPISLDSTEIAVVLQNDFANHSLFCNSICEECMINLKCPRCYGMSYKCKQDLRYRETFLCTAYKIQFLSNMVLMQKRINAGLEEDDKERLLAVIEYTRKYLFHNNI